MGGLEKPNSPITPLFHRDTANGTLSRLAALCRFRHLDKKSIEEVMTCTEVFIDRHVIKATGVKTFLLGSQHGEGLEGFPLCNALWLSVANEIVQRIWH